MEINFFGIESNINTNGILIKCLFKHCVIIVFPNSIYEFLGEMCEDPSPAPLGTDQDVKVFPNPPSPPALPFMNSISSGVGAEVVNVKVLNFCRGERLAWSPSRKHPSRCHKVAGAS